MEERSGGPFCEVCLEDKDMATGSDQAYFRTIVLSLTESAHAVGLGKAVELFLALPENNAHPRLVCNGVSDSRNTLTERTITN
ncbi:Ff.00g077870.m01.CDS01 [Fusarium sp. VM40]|nr:Ff.00g077870.m01.CDS01 [Fusarium sp. VM40]